MHVSGTLVLADHALPPGRTLPVDGSTVTQPVSATALPLPAGAATSALQTQPGVDIGDVTINNASGVSAVNIQDGGNAITVDGTVTANAGTGPFPVSDNAGSLTVDAPVGTPAFVRLSDGVAAITTLPISAASLPLPSGAATLAGQTQPGVDIGDVTINNASGASAVNIQDGGNAITVDGTVALGAGAAAIGTVALGAGTAAVGTVTDGGSGKTLKSASFSLTATGTVIAAVGGRRLKVYAVKLVVSAAISVNWRDGATTALEGAQALAANGGFTEGINPPAFLFGTTAGNSLDLVIAGTGTAAGRVSYWDDDAS